MEPSREQASTLAPDATLMMMVLELIVLVVLVLVVVEVLVVRNKQQT